MAIDTDSWRATSVSLTIKSRNTVSEAAARGTNARSSSPRTIRAQRELADIVVRVDDEPHEGERVLDFLALVETDAADDLVAQTFAHQRVFNRPRLGV